MLVPVNEHCVMETSFGFYVLNLLKHFLLCFDLYIFCYYLNIYKNKRGIECKNT